MKPTLEQVIAYAQSDLSAPAPPSPFEIALHLAGALLSSGRYVDDMGAAMDTAWTLVPTFYQGQLAYERQMHTLAAIARHVSAAGPGGTVGGVYAAGPDAAMSPEETRAYITGGSGETGDIGEAGGQAAPLATVNVAAVRERQTQLGALKASIEHAAAQLQGARDAGLTDKVAQLEEALAVAERTRNEVLAADLNGGSQTT